MPVLTRIAAAEAVGMLAEELGRALKENGFTISTAESCTGGMVGAAITSVSGSSEYYLGGVISYSNDAKIKLLSVDPHALESEGAVSETVAIQMAEGCRRGFESDLSLSTTGIAGPTGGTAEKPVGLVFICVCSSSRCNCTRNMFDGDRESIREQTVETALRMVLDLVRASD